MLYLLYDIILLYVSWSVTMLSNVTDVWQHNLTTLTLTLHTKSRQMKINQKRTGNKNKNKSKSENE